jgi:hypothetical protein
MTNNFKLPENATEALIYVAQAKFRKFNEYDWQSYAGCVSEEPLIYDDANDHVIIIDGEIVSFILYVLDDDVPSEDGVATFRLKSI